MKEQIIKTTTGVIANLIEDEEYRHLAIFTGACLVTATVGTLWLARDVKKINKEEK